MQRKIFAEGRPEKPHSQYRSVLPTKLSCWKESYILWSTTINSLDALFPSKHPKQQSSSQEPVSWALDVLDFYVYGHQLWQFLGSKAVFFSYHSFWKTETSLFAAFSTFNWVIKWREQPTSIFFYMNHRDHAVSKHRSHFIFSWEDRQHKEVSSYRMKRLISCLMFQQENKCQMCNKNACWVIDVRSRAHISKFLLFSMFNRSFSKKVNTMKHKTHFQLILQLLYFLSN